MLLNVPEKIPFRKKVGFHYRQGLSLNSFLKNQRVFYHVAMWKMLEKKEQACWLVSSRATMLEDEL